MRQWRQSFSLGTILPGLSGLPCVYLLRMLEGLVEGRFDDIRFRWEAHVALIILLLLEGVRSIGLLLEFFKSSPDILLDKCLLS